MKTLHLSSNNHPCSLQLLRILVVIIHFASLRPSFIASFNDCMMAFNIK